MSRIAAVEDDAGKPDRRITRGMYADMSQNISEEDVPIGVGDEDEVEETILSDELIARDLSQVGQKRKKQTHRAIVLFNEFLHSLDRPEYRDIDDVDAEFLSRTMLGTFAGFLVAHPGIWYGTTLNYYSCIKCYLEALLPDHALWKGRQRWSGYIRSSINVAYMKQCEEQGRSMVKDVSSCERSDLIELCTLLYHRGTARSLELRDLVIKQYQCIGRVTEPAKLKMHSLSWSSTLTSIKMKYYATKTSTTSMCNLIVDRDSWAVCPIQSTATTVILNTDVTGSTSPYYHCIPTTETISNTLNQILKELEQGFSSHGLKHGSTMACGSDSGLAWHWIGHRAGSVLSLVGKMFVYLKETEGNDARVAKVLSGWPSHHPNVKAGVLPGFSQEYREANPKLTALRDYLFGHVLEIYTNDMVWGLMSALVMNFEPMSKASAFQVANIPDTPVNALLAKIHNAQIHAGMSKSELLDHGSHLRRMFNATNVLALPPSRVISEFGEEVAGKLTLGLPDLVNFLEITTSSCGETLLNSQKCREELLLLKQNFGEMQRQIEVNHQMLKTLLEKDNLVLVDRVPVLPPVADRVFAFRNGLADVSVKSAFMEYFLVPLYEVPQQVSKRGINNLSALRTLTGYLCALGDPGMVIGPRPTGLAEYRVWLKNITDIAECVSGRAHTICWDYKRATYTGRGDAKAPASTATSIHRLMVKAAKMCEVCDFPAVFSQGLDSATPTSLKPKITIKKSNGTVVYSNQE